ncbi:MAG: hypothetical protein AMXMBFR66_30230 [Pseudomonadota bacterium]|nr:DUF962 domain-containing protein [Rubrivivax sp.]
MPRLFRPALDLLVQYARCHRDRRNIATHFVGVPMMVLALSVLLARPALEVSGWAATPARAAFVPLALWYLTRGAPALGAATALGVGLLVLLGHGAAAGTSLTTWLAWGLGLFALGGTAVLLGHYYEGRRAACAGDAVGVLVGPMFVALEMLGACGLLRRLHGEVERRAGPTTLRDLAQPLAR